MLNHAGSRILSCALLATLVLGCSVGSDGDDQADETVAIDHGDYQTVTSRLNGGFYTEIIDDDSGAIVATAEIDRTGAGALDVDGVSTSIIVDVSTLDAIGSSVFLSWEVLQGGATDTYDEDLGYWCAVGCGNGRCCVCCASGCSCEDEHKA